MAHLIAVPLASVLVMTTGPTADPSTLQEYGASTLAIAEGPAFRGAEAQIFIAVQSTPASEDWISDVNSQELLLSPAIRSMEALIKKSHSGTGDIEPISTRAETVTRALLAYMLDESQAHHLPWKAPHVSSEGDGDLMLRWTGPEGRSLSLHISGEGQIEFLKAWGSDIVAEMEEGKLNIPSQCFDLWHWLIKA